MTVDPAAAAFLHRQRVGHLATADATGEPLVVPVCYALLGGVVYSVVDQKPKRGAAHGLQRVRNVLANPRAALVVDVYDEDWSRLGYVLLKGAARIVERGPEHTAALDALRARYSQYRAMELDDRPVLALNIERVIAWGVALREAGTGGSTGTEEPRGR